MFLALRVPNAAGKTSSRNACLNIVNFDATQPKCFQLSPAGLMARDRANDVSVSTRALVIATYSCAKRSNQRSTRGKPSSSTATWPRPSFCTALRWP
jgi:hypothetical protein